MKHQAEPSPEMPLSAALTASFLCVIFGANIIAVKITVTSTGPFFSNLIRFLIASSIIAVWAWITKRSFSIKPGARLYMLIISVIFAIQLTLFNLGLQQSSATVSTLIANMQPFFILVLAHFFIPGDTITWRKVAGVLLGFSGIILIFYHQIQQYNGLQYGDLFLILSTLLWSANTIFVKRIMDLFLPFQVVLYPMLFSIPIFFILSMLYDPTAVNAHNSRIVLAFLFQGAISAAFGFVLWNTLLKRYGATSLHTYVFIIPVAGVLLSHLILKEELHPNFIASLFFISAGILVVHIKPEKISVFPFRRGSV